MLNLPGENLTPKQFQQLEKKLMDNADVFAIDESELGHTTVKHSIDTGEHPPIKQCPRRTPLIHREKIAQPVNDKLKQQVVQPSSSAWTGVCDHFGLNEVFRLQILCKDSYSAAGANARPNRSTNRDKNLSRTFNASLDTRYNVCHIKRKYISCQIARETGDSEFPSQSVLLFPSSSLLDVHISFN